MNSAEQQPAYSESVVPPPATPYRIAGDLIFTSGQVGADEQWQPVTNTIREETTQVFENLEATLHEAGSSLDSVLHIRTYLADMVAFEEFNQVWRERFPSNPPSRTTVQAGLHPPFNVDCEAVALVSRTPAED